MRIFQIHRTRGFHHQKTWGIAQFSQIHGHCGEDGRNPEAFLETQWLTELVGNCQLDITRWRVWWPTQGYVNVPKKGGLPQQNLREA